MTVNKNITLEKVIISKILEIASTKTFTANSPLFYEGHVPIVAYLVIRGSITLLKNKKIKSIVRVGGLIGLHELMNERASKYNAEVQAEAILCFLDKSTILEILKNNHSELNQIIKEAIEYDMNIRHLA